MLSVVVVEIDLRSDRVCLPLPSQLNLERGYGEQGRYHYSAVATTIGRRGGAQQLGANMRGLKKEVSKALYEARALFDERIEKVVVEWSALKLCRLQTASRSR